MSTDPWEYQPAADLDLPLEERLKTFPREPDMTVYLLRSIASLLLRAWLRVYHRLRIEGRDRIPAEGSFVLVANHSSHLDAPTLASALPLRQLHRVFPAAAKDYFFSSVARTTFSAIVVNALPFDRRERPEQSLNICDRLLKNPGNVLIIFPEGTRTETGALQRFKPGVALLVRGTPIPVIPCYLDGAYRAWPKGSLFPRPVKLTLRIGEPRTYEHGFEGKRGLLDIANDLQEAVARLATSEGGGDPVSQNDTIKED